MRSSLRLYNIRLAHQSERLAWLAHFLPQLPGNGIVYCLTIQDARRVAAWLQENGIAARAYHAELDGAERSSDHQTGGTWAGAVEALKAGWCPVLARHGHHTPQGNKELLKLGATALTEAELSECSNLAEWVRQHARNTRGEPEFDFALRDAPR